MSTRKSTHLHTHMYKYTNANLQNSYFTTRHTSFLRRVEMLNITTFRCNGLSGEGEATEICGPYQVAVLSRMRVMSRVIHCT